MFCVSISPAARGIQSGSVCVLFSVPPVAVAAVALALGYGNIVAPVCAGIGGDTMVRTHQNRNAQSVVPLQLPLLCTKKFFGLGGSRGVVSPGENRGETVVLEVNVIKRKWGFD